MIADALSDAVDEIDGYLARGLHPAPGPLLDRVRAMRGMMDALRAELDTQQPLDPQQWAAMNRVVK